MKTTEITIKPDRLLAVVDYINNFVSDKKFKGANLVHFRTLFQKSKAYHNLNAEEKKNIYKAKEVVEALKPIMSTSNVTAENLNQYMVEEGEDNMEERIIKTTTDDGNTEDFENYFKNQINKADAVGNETNETKAGTSEEISAEEDADGVFILKDKKYYEFESPVEVNVQIDGETKDGVEIVEFSYDFYEDLKVLIEKNRVTFEKLIELIPEIKDVSNIAKVDDLAVLGLMSKISTLVEKYGVEEVMIPPYLACIATELDIEIDFKKFIGHQPEADIIESETTKALIIPFNKLMGNRNDEYTRPRKRYESVCDIKLEGISRRRAAFNF